MKVHNYIGIFSVIIIIIYFSGCNTPTIKIETGDEDLLAQHRQNPDLQMMREKIDLIKKSGIRVKGLLMMGLPGETEASILKIEKNKEVLVKQLSRETVQIVVKN